MAGPSILVRFMADTKEFKKGVDEVSGTSEGFTQKLGNVAKAIGTAFAAKKIVDFAKDSIAAAQDLNANMSRTKSIFGDSATAITDWSKTSASSLRLSQAEALGAANTVGKTLVGSFGMSGESAAAMSANVVNLARDMAAFNRVPFSEALDKVTAGLNGQTRGLKTLGVSLTKAEIDAKAVSMGLAKTTVDMTKVEQAQRGITKSQIDYNTAVKKHGENSAEAKKALLGVEAAQAKLDTAMAGGKTTMDGAAKAQATFALMLEKTELQQGATAKGAGSLKAQQERLSAEWKNAQATVGQQLLPVLTQLAQIASQILVPAIQTLASIFKALGPALTPVVAGVLAFAAGIKIAAIAQNLFNVSLLTNPITWVVIAIVALVAAIVVLATKTQFFQTIFAAMGSVVGSVVSAVQAAFNAVVSAVSTAVSWVVGFVRANWPLLVGIMLGPVGIVIAAIYTFRSQIQSAIQSAIDFVLGVWRSGWSAVTGVVSGAAGAIAGAASSIVSGVRSALSTIGEVFAAPFRAARDAVVSIVSGIVSTVEGIINTLKSVVNTALSPLRSLLSAIGSVEFRVEVPGWIPGIGGKGWGFKFPDFSHYIPHLQKGGVISWPTVALLGESRQREVVAPEPLLREIVRSEGGRQGPAVHIEHVELAERIDLDLFLKRVGWAVQTGIV